MRNVYIKIFLNADTSHYEQFADGTVKCIEDEIPFEVPEGWCWCRLKDVFVLNPKNSLEDEDIVAFIPMTLVADEFSNSFEAYS
ncbi:hypothetical protein [Paludibacter sp. 221]|uniref:hypothetical protein n=1 Tax=Paludibacter sp. 221 TaxID=2302939 RepID=UPI0019456FC6|nr:hypothetical protein [Paludibacter sp. 221]